jgi:hypothetical protein
MHCAPIPLIEVHFLFMRFGMAKEDDRLPEAPWGLAGSERLTLEDALWIWVTLQTLSARERRGGDAICVARTANHCTQMVAWQLVNMEAEGTWTMVSRNLLSSNKRRGTSSIHDRIEWVWAGKEHFKCRRRQPQD